MRLCLVGMLAVEADPIFRGSSAIAFEPIHQSLVVKVKKDKKDDDDDDEKPKKDKKAKNCKKARCEPGMFVLEKPNIYGACCQAGAEPLKHNTKPDEPKKCQFPGEVPPDCNCPKGTEFLGYKGCVKKAAQPAPVALKSFDCTVNVVPKGGITNYGTYTSAASESEAKAKALKLFAASGYVANGDMSCKQR